MFCHRQPPFHTSQYHTLNFSFEKYGLRTYLWWHTRLTKSIINWVGYTQEKVTFYIGSTSNCNFCSRSITYRQCIRCYRHCAILTTVTKIIVAKWNYFSINTSKRVLIKSVICISYCKNNPSFLSGT